MSRRRRISRAVALPVIGLATVLCGFIWDVVFAGIPYQDPTPQLQARWELHRSTADALYASGGVLIVLGLVALPFLLRGSRGVGCPVDRPIPANRGDDHE